MYDLWYSLGVAVMRPALLDQIQAAGPKFNFLKSRVFIETKLGAPAADPPITNNKTAGLLDLQQTSKVRTAIRKGIAAVFAPAPPVSFYTAGKFSQFLAIPLIDSVKNRNFRAIMALATVAYRNALGGAAEGFKPAFPALLGLCLVDPTFQKLIANTTNGPGPWNEFGVDGTIGSHDWDVIRRFVADTNFQEAHKSLTTGDNNTWDPGGSSSEQFFDWEGHSERAVF